MSTTTPQFGPLATPIHQDAAGPGEPPWRDNAYLGFWDDSRQVFGEVHVSTSPNGAGLRARVEVYVTGRLLEIDEVLDRGTFRSESIDFDIDGVVRIAHPELTLDLEYTPRFSPVDYSPGGVMGGLVDGKPLIHWEQGCGVRGSLRALDEEIEIEGHGFRDRTWGYRNEGLQWREYLTVWGVFDDFDLTAMKFIGADGKPVLDGFVVDANASRRVTAMDYTYDAAGLFKSVVLTLDDGERRTVSAGPERAGFWLPMGPPEQYGPAFHAYDEFLALDAWGSAGKGIIGYGILRAID